VKRFVMNEAHAPDLRIWPVPFPRDKGPNTFRILVQGESTAAGYPYGFPASVAGMLKQRLQRTFPARRVEMITTAMAAVSSHAVRDFTSEILAQDPDAVLIYAGHNEYVGLLGVGSGYSVGRAPVVLTFLALRELRLFQLLARAANAWSSDETPYHDTSRTLMATIVREKRIPFGSETYQRGLAQYRANLDAILRRYQKAGVPVFIATVVSNERDRPPFQTGHGPGADAAAWQRRFDAGTRALGTGDARRAVDELEAAVAIDPAEARGHYALGQALERLGRHADARRAYLTAKDRDELRFRAPEEVNRIIREVARRRGAHVVEVEAAFSAAAEHGIVGNDLMLEHVHPNVAGYFLLADAFYEALHAEQLIGPWVNPVARDQAWSEVPVTAVDRLFGEHCIAALTSDWPFTQQRKDFDLPPATDPVETIAAGYFEGRFGWPEAMRRLLQYSEAAGDAAEAVKVAVSLADRFPYRRSRQQRAAELLLATGRPEARIYLDQATALAAGEESSLLAGGREDARRVSDDRVPPDRP
jgi:lysophospholipase L1-like esterase